MAEKMAKKCGLTDEVLKNEENGRGTINTAGLI